VIARAEVLAAVRRGYEEVLDMPSLVNIDQTCAVIADRVVAALAQEGDRGEAVDWPTVERSLRKRLDDWLGSTSEFYARERQGRDGGESWRAGLVGYLLRGPGALDKVLTRAEAIP
jgi:hypothetical protein